MNPIKRDGWGFVKERGQSGLPRETPPLRAPDDLRTTMHGFDEFFRFEYFLSAQGEQGDNAPTAIRSSSALERQ
jgi:hypothetical protein